MEEFDKDKIDQIAGEIVSFKKGDKTVYLVENYDGSDIMASISGYELDVNFNLEVINSIEDAEAMANGLADIFYKTLMDQLIKEKPNITNHNADG